MKCPNCRAMVDDNVERCTFCGNYLKGSMMSHYKLDNYDPTQGYRKPQPVQPVATDEPKPRFRLFKSKT